MFDTVKIGKQIAARRKAQNLTQAALADLMGVSFQAVSNWERGNSMPDIGKLPDLTRALGCTMDDLLGQTPGAKLVEHLADGTEASYLDTAMPDAATLADVAPIVSPKKAEALCDTLQEKTPESLDIASIAALAPFLSEEYLDRLVTSCSDKVSIGELPAIAPFLSQKTLDSICANAASSNLGELAAIAPFVSDEALANAAKRAATKNLGELAAIAPFLSEETLGSIVMDTVVSGEDAGSIAALAPFLPDTTLEKIADVLIRRGDKRVLLSIAPFLR